VGSEPYVGRSPCRSEHVVIAQWIGAHYIICCDSWIKNDAVERVEDMKMAVARPRPQVVRLTDAAAERIKAVMANADRPIAAVRVGVKNGGCAGMSYTMEYAAAIDPKDEVVEDKGVRILIDPKAVLFLLGTEMDYKIDKLSAQFVFNNPNQTSACGCGESVQLEPASGEAR
jgi:iron-sulfur cluster assembly protein